MSVQLTPEAEAFLARAPVARLATASADGRPHVVPITFVWLAGSLWSALDAKPKRVARLQLRRVRNLLANPNAAVVVDRYANDWRQLGYVLLEGTARLVSDGARAERARDALRAKYPAYREGPWHLEHGPLIELAPTHVSEWGKLG